MATIVPLVVLISPAMSRGAPAVGVGVAGAPADLPAGLVPVKVLDLTPDTIPYWELRERSSVATGIEEPFLTAYREGSFHYLMIVADRI